MFKIADVPFDVRCRYKENLDFLEDYRTDDMPRFTIESSEDDLKKMQKDFDILSESGGYEKTQYSGAFLENNVILALLSEKMAFFNVLQLHGSAICMDGEAYIFSAPSGTGKSTHTKLWREAFGNRTWMINDDKPMIKITEDGAVAYGSPWNGKHQLGRNSSAPLKAIIFYRAVKQTI